MSQRNLHASQWDDPHAGAAEVEARGHRQDVPLSISQLNWYIKNVLEQAVPKVWVEGEVSDLSRPSSGHVYFTLKDDRSQVRAVIWRSTAARLKFDLKDGLSVVCQGAVDVYPPRGSYQLIINRLQPQGLGALQLAFQQLHEKLSAQGLFDVSRKKPLPAFPRSIGLISSPTGAAVHDFLEAAKDRWSDLEILLIPTRVQGEFAAKEIVRAIEQAHRVRPALDVLVLARGGGSMEDLWCFNEEAVVRAINRATLPIVSAIGHEIDVTLSDLAADARALTPTHAAHLVLPSRNEVQDRLFQVQQRMMQSLKARVRSMRVRLEGLTERGILARPHEIHKSRRQQVDEMELRSRRGISHAITERKERLKGLVRAAEALSPLNVLARGYSLSRKLDSSQALRSASEVSVGETIESKLQHGSLISRVEVVNDVDGTN